MTELTTEEARKRWEAAAPGWAKWEPVLESGFRAATETMLDMAHVRPGTKLLDLACGAGSQSFQAAERVGSTGAVVASDISASMLSHVRDRSRRLGVRNIETLECAAEDLSSSPPRVRCRRVPARFDAVSRPLAGGDSGQKCSGTGWEIRGAGVYHAIEQPIHGGADGHSSAFRAKGPSRTGCARDLCIGCSWSAPVNDLGMWLRRRDNGGRSPQIEPCFHARSARDDAKRIRRIPSGGSRFIRHRARLGVVEGRRVPVAVRNGYRMGDRARSRHRVGKRFSVKFGSRRLSCPILRTFASPDGRTFFDVYCIGRA